MLPTEEDAYSVGGSSGTDTSDIGGDIERLVNNSSGSSSSELVKIARLSHFPDDFD
jgi:hypothetical protein